MARAAIQRLLGQLLLLFGATLLAPMLVSVAAADGEAVHFAEATLLTVALGLTLWLPVRGAGADLRPRDGFLVVALFWVVLGLCAALPFVLGPHLRPLDAVFEAVSGFTTTGATVMSGLDGQAPSILLYRALLQWLGGMGVVVLAVAVMPMLGMGGMQLYRAEIPGPMKEEKLTPRLLHTARALWLIYLGLTALCALAYRLGGMGGFDAVTHALTTVSTGGFSTHDASFAYFRSPLLEALAVVFMALGATNFAVHFAALRGAGLAAYARDPEVRAFVALLVVAGAALALVLYLTGAAPAPLGALRQALFQAVSVMTSTGFTTADFSAWPLFAPVFLMYVGIVGGCAGSTAGGMKVVRVLLLARQGWRELVRLPHPRSVRPVRLGGRVVAERTVSAVWGFFAVYVASFVALMVLMMATGLDQVTAFSAVVACLNNLGPGLGEVSASFQHVNDAAKAIAVVAMLLGRLEVFTLLVLFSPAFWRP